MRRLTIACDGGGEMLFGDREKEVLRKMIWQVADFCGVEIDLDYE